MHEFSPRGSILQMAISLSKNVLWFLNEKPVLKKIINATNWSFENVSTLILIFFWDELFKLFKKFPPDVLFLVSSLGPKNQKSRNFWNSSCHQTIYVALPLKEKLCSILVTEARPIKNHLRRNKNSWENIPTSRNAFPLSFLPSKSDVSALKFSFLLLEKNLLFLKRQKKLLPDVYFL